MVRASFSTPLESDREGLDLLFFAVDFAIDFVLFECARSFAGPLGSTSAGCPSRPLFLFRETVLSLSASVDDLVFSAFAIGGASPARRADSFEAAGG